MKSLDKTKKEWVYAIVCDPEKNPVFLGLYDSCKKASFIPVFHEKNEAEQCFLSLPKEHGRRYEIQAVHITEISKDAQENGFMLTVLDGEGKILQQHGDMEL